jgi:DNA polymerase-3 subunit epsilon
MKYIIADTETSGLNTSTAEMYSFGAFSVETAPDGTLDMNTLKAVHRFFNTDNEVPADAAAVHGLSRAMLLCKSNGDYLEDCYNEITDFVYSPDAYLVGYNTSFDQKIIVNNFAKAGLNLPKWRGVIDVMNEQKVLLKGTGYDKIRIKLTKASDLILRDKCGYSVDKLNAVFDLFKRTCGITDADVSYHSALYDSFKTLMIFREVLNAKR